MITGCFGLPGSGKSTFLAWCASRALLGKSLKVGKVSMQHNRKYDRVFTNYPYSGCYVLDTDKLGTCDFSNCLILIDEIACLWDSRNWKYFSGDVSYFFSHHRKYNVDIVYCSQSYKDCDLRIRDKTENVFYITPWLFSRFRVQPLIHFMGVENFQIIDGYDPSGFFGCKYLSYKKYYTMFDTNSRKTLAPLKDLTKWE